MDKSVREAAELNEVGWWSGWGRVRWLGEACYILESKDFDEPFFNRAGFLSCDASAARLSEVESVFRSAGRDPLVSIFEPCEKAFPALVKRGYIVADRMAVLRMRKPAISVNDAVHVREARQRDIDGWCEAYLLSFYEGLDLKPRVARIAKRVAQLEPVTLLVAELDGEVAGATALYRSPRFLGLYCLGTVPKHRGKRVAHSLLGRAQMIAESERRKLVLQSLLSEGAEGFYLESGFERLYSKTLLQMPAGGSSRKEREFGTTRFGASVIRNPGAGLHSFSGVFRGFENVPAVRSIFGARARRVLTELQVEVVDEKGYMHINAAKGSVVVSAGYLKEADERYLYLDIIHELVHIRQHIEGKELWDRNYKYVDRPTELEAYRLAVAEARRIGLTDNQLVEYLKVEWVSPEDFSRLLVTLSVGSGRKGRPSRASGAR